MKTIFNMVLASLTCFAVFCGCTGGDMDKKNELEIVKPVDEPDPEKPGTFEGLSAQTEKRILQDYYNASDIPKKDEITISGYYGTYNGCVVVSFRTPYGYPGVGWGASIAGIRFFHGDISQIPVVWKEGLFYTGGPHSNGLQEAYDLGLLTRDDLINIAGLFNVY